MIALKITVESELTSKAGHNRLMKRLNLQAGQRMKRRFGRKFENNPDTRAGGGYGYEKRAKEYQIAKAKIKKHQKPNVWKGEMRARVMQSLKVIATKDRMVLRATANRRIEPERKHELEAVSQRELQQDAKWYGSEYVRLAGNSRYTRRRRRKHS